MAQIGPNVGRIHAELGRNRAKFGPLGSNVAESYPRRPRSCRSQPTSCIVGQNRHSFGRSRPNSRRARLRDGNYTDFSRMSTQHHYNASSSSSSSCPPPARERRTTCALSLSLSPGDWRRPGSGAALPASDILRCSVSPRLPNDALAHRVMPRGAARGRPRSRRRCRCRRTSRRSLRGDAPKRPDPRGVLGSEAAWRPAQACSRWRGPMCQCGRSSSR